MAFSKIISLPEYLEEALEPLSWSGLFSKEFKENIINILLASNPIEAVERFAKSLYLLKFLDDQFKRNLVDALEQFAHEKIKKINV